MIFITGRNKESISDHFDAAYELENELEQRGKHKLLKIVREVTPPHISCVFIRQSHPLGLGHAVLCAEPVVDDEPFAVLLADDLIDDEDGSGCLAQMVGAFSETGSSILGTERIRPEDTSSYGIVDTGGDDRRFAQVSGIVEKPAPADAPSNRAVVGRYILTSRIFHHLAQTGRGAGGEIQLTDGIARLLAEQQVFALNFRGKRYDCGSKLGYLQATVDYALKHQELADGFRGWLHERFK
jgi:UTP--glucose-1-phosphate uridylyltransferase